MQAQQEYKLIEKLEREGNSIELQFEPFDAGITRAVGDALSAKTKSRNHKRLSFSRCKIGLAPSATIDILAKLFQEANVEVVGLNGNELGTLSPENFGKILAALQSNPSIKKIELNENSLGPLIVKHPQLFIDFLTTTSATYLSLENNNISDDAATLLGTHSQFLSINLKNNHLRVSQKNLMTNDGCKTFLTNPYVIDLNLSGSNVQPDMYALIKRNAANNKASILANKQKELEKPFINEIIAAGQGVRPGQESFFSRLPNEIIMIIFKFMGQHLTSNVTHVCSLVLGNFQKSPPGKLVWDKAFEIKGKLTPIFQLKSEANSNHFFKPHHLAAVTDHENESTRKSSPFTK